MWKGGEDLGRIVDGGHQVIASSADAWYLDCGSGSFIDGGRSWCDPFKVCVCARALSLFACVCVCVAVLVMVIHGVIRSSCWGL